MSLAEVGLLSPDVRDAFAWSLYVERLNLELIPQIEREDYFANGKPIPGIGERKADAKALKAVAYPADEDS